MAISTYLSIVTLDVNGLNAPIKRHKIADWIKKQVLSIEKVEQIETKVSRKSRKRRIKWSQS